MNRVNIRQKTMRRARAQLRPTCRACYCIVHDARALCESCVRAPHSLSALDILNDDGSTCVACHMLICPLHTSVVQREARLCNNCSVAAPSISLAAAQRPPPLDCYFADAPSSSDVDMNEYDRDDSLEEQVTTPLSYRHAFGIEYDEGSSEDDVLHFVDAWIEDSRIVRRACMPLLKKPYDVVQADTVHSPAADCSICLEPLAPTPTDTMAVMHCHKTHAFHTTCIDTWLDQQAVTCPLCQHKFNVL